METTAVSALEGWVKLREAFQVYCDRMVNLPTRYDFECAEQSPYEFTVERRRGMFCETVMSFKLDPTIPRVHWANNLRRHPSERQGYLDLVAGPKDVSYRMGTRGYVLGEFVEGNMMHAHR